MNDDLRAKLDQIKRDTRTNMDRLREGMREAREALDELREKLGMLEPWEKFARAQRRIERRER